MEIDKMLLKKVVFITAKVVNGLPIVQVFHDNDGDWQFFSYDDEITESNAKIASLEEVLQLDKSLKKVVATLPKGFEAYRNDEKSEWYIKYDDGRIENLN